MAWQDDPFWKAASDAALRAAPEVDCVLVPAEFLPLSARFAPLEYGWASDARDQRLAWCCPKNDVDRLAPWLLDAHGARSRCAWSNEVFVLEGNFDWPLPADQESRRHWSNWAQRVRRYRAGKPSRPLALRRVREPLSARSPRVLIIGASGMGNVGDDLLADALAAVVHDLCGAQISLSGPDVDPLLLKQFDVVLVGPGGLVYERRGAQDESQNLVNYLKFGLQCKHFSVPVALVAVGDQQVGPDPAPGSWAMKFAQRSLSAFSFITTRDEGSTELLRRWGAPNVQTGCDLAFLWLDRAQKSIRPGARQPPRVAFGGELARVVGLEKRLEESIATAGGELAALEIDLLVMSDDDEPHIARIEQMLRQAGIGCSRVDLRGKAFDVLVYLIGSYEAIITTRFHAVVLAGLAGVPVLALYEKSGKIDRLLIGLGASASGVDMAEMSAAARVVDALKGDALPLSEHAVRKMADGVVVHRQELQQFWPQDRPGPGPASASSIVPNELPALAPAPGARGDRLDLVRRQRFGAPETIALCWAASTPETDGFANLGDSLSAVMTCALAGKRVQHVGFNVETTKLVAVGSIAHAISRGEAIVWGSGVSIRGGLLAQNVPQTRYDIRAVRGEISARHLRDFGIGVPDVFGDPVWLLPSIFDEPIEKRYELGVIPHIQDIDGTAPDSPAREGSVRSLIDPADAGSIVLINTWHEATWEGLKAKLRLMLSCKRIVSQSFHGVVIAEAYGIPVLHFRQYRGAKRNGLATVKLSEPCTTDPRIWEFYKSGKRSAYSMYAQRRQQRTDWEQVVKVIDHAWRPFEYDAAPLVDAFPLPLAYDPLRARADAEPLLNTLRF